MSDPLSDEDEWAVDPYKRRRARRIHVNRKLKARDRWKTKYAKYVREHKPRRFRNWWREDCRLPTHPDTGYGVAHDVNVKLRSERW